MGKVVDTLRKKVEALAGDNPLVLRLGGMGITGFLVLISGFLGWRLEKLALGDTNIPKALTLTILIVSLASTIASKSLRERVCSVLEKLPQGIEENNLDPGRNALSQIVGRDVHSLDRKEILRAAAETASENSVDGVFAPIFWMLVGVCSWEISTNLPGPLAFALVFKASSTLDSMIGYRYGRLKWLGSTGALLDDLLTWIPCRIVLVTLPLISKPINQVPSIIALAIKDGSKDESPNSGISEAIFAHCVGIKLGGENIYKSRIIRKSILNSNGLEASPESIKKILKLSLMLEFTWFLFSFLVTSLIYM